ncbi:hypothetical protein WJX72_006730 [[Myrmecia] bisecta]|uniref:Uncharacterized protein n=1 Tax=[Myrmecia] bisecta TaxID=41462 RepID=A0AAW1PQ20_9CHLO
MDMLQSYISQPALCSAQPDPGPAYISATGVALGAALIVVNAIVSFMLELDLHWQLLIAAIRCVVQLLVLGYILVPIFTAGLWWLVLLYSCFMLLVGCWEAVSRPSYTYMGMLCHALVSVGSAAAVFLSYGLLLIIRTKPWWQAQYFIPVLGMLLGNCISGVSVGLSTVLEELTTGKDRVELLLAFGASRWEATKQLVQRAVKLACTPILNQMNVVGIVSIPGMMTGQILAGSDPSQAARYQMIVMFLIAATTAVGSVASVLFATFNIVDTKHRIRSDRLKKKDKRNGWAKKMGDDMQRVCKHFEAGLKKMPADNAATKSLLAHP